MAKFKTLIRDALPPRLLRAYLTSRDMIERFVPNPLVWYAILSYRRAKSLGRELDLTTIANYHASDKGTLHGYGNWPFRGHGYTRFYERLFRDWRHKAGTLIEIGIGVEGPGALGSTVFGRNRGGASLKTWYDFFPNTQICGIDINPAHFLDNDRIRTFVGSQHSRSKLSEIVEEIGGRIDIVIDDGSHASKHQQISLACLFPYLADDGIYIIEDLDFQPPSIEAKNDPKTAKILETFISTGQFDSPFMSEREKEYIRTHAVECSIERDQAGRALVGVLRKKRSHHLGEIVPPGRRAG